MADSETPASCFCSPERLLKQIVGTSEQNVIHLTGRNTNERFDKVNAGSVVVPLCTKLCVLMNFVLVAGWILANSLQLLPSTSSSC